MRQLGISYARIIIRRIERLVWRDEQCRGEESRGPQSQRGDVLTTPQQMGLQLAELSEVVACYGLW